MSLSLHDFRFLARDGAWDLHAGLTDELLSRTLNLCLSAGVIPAHHETTNSGADGNIGLFIKSKLSVDMGDVRVSFLAGEHRSIGIEIDYSGEIEITTTLDDWNITTPGGSYHDAGFNEVFSLPFDGRLRASTALAFVEVDKAKVLVMSFDHLESLTFHQIGDLHIGPIFNEVAGKIFERIMTVTLRTSVRLPKINGLPASLPTPADWIVDTANGELGILDLKSVGGMGGSDEVHVLIQAEQNKGQQSYDDVVPFTNGSFDVGVALTYRLLRQILQDLWIGRIIPRRFNLRGIPDVNGKVYFSQLGITLFPGTIQIRVKLVGNVITGIPPLEVDGTFEVAPHVSAGYLSFTLVNSSIDIGFDWAVKASWSAIFFIAWELLGKLLLRAANGIIAPWIRSQLDHFLATKRIDLRQSAKWSGTPFTVDITPCHLEIDSTMILTGFQLGIHY